MTDTDDTDARELTLIKILMISSLVVPALLSLISSIAGIICWLIALVVMFLALGKLCRLSGSETLRKNFVKMILYPFVGGVIIAAGTPFMMEMRLLAILFMLLGIGFVLGSLVVMFKYNKELYAITQQPLFLWTFWIMLTPLNFIGWLLHILAWILAKDVYEAEEVSVSTLEWVCVFLVPILSFGLLAVLLASFAGGLLEALPKPA